MKEADLIRETSLPVRDADPPQARCGGIEDSAADPSRGNSRQYLMCRASGLSPVPTVKAACWKVGLDKTARTPFDSA